MKINSNVEKPNFFIIGAPKCGTTALSEYLREHKDIFFAYPKEPTFFCSDFSDKYRRVHTMETYLNQCFYNSKGYKRIGEGTVWYLMSEVAIDKILEFNPSAKFIVMVRNPIDLAYSMHSTELYGGNEEVEDFKTAWNLQETRKKGESIPSFCRETKILQYGEIAKNGKHIKKLLTKVDADKLKIIVFDDFKKNAKQVYQETLSFLDLEDDGRVDFPVFNENKKNKSRLIALLLSSLGRVNIGMIKRRLGIKPGKSILKVFRKWNADSLKREPLSDEFKSELKNYFKDDVELLGKLINRDLSHWIK